MKNTGRVVVALILIVLGLGLLLEQLGVGSFASFWPLIFVILGVYLLWRRSIVPGLFFIVIAAIFESSVIYDFNAWATLWPLILIAIGVAILLERTVGRRSWEGWEQHEGDTHGEHGDHSEQHQHHDNHHGAGTETHMGPVTSSSSDFIEQFVMFWGLERRITSKNFKGGSLTCLFGGAKIDLRDAVMAKDGATLDIFCAFGGVEIVAPRNLRVDVAGTPIIGGFSDKTRGGDSAQTQTLHITGSAIFGGVEVKD